MSTRRVREAFAVSEALVYRFSSKCVNADSGCVLWSGAIDPSGYGRLKIEGHSMNAHVAAWRIAHGGVAVPVGKLVMHTCENKSCVNPLHLELGTTSENMKFAWRVGTELRKRVPRGRKCHNAVLSVRLVRQIRRLHRPGVYGATRIARRFGLKRDVVDALLRGRTWVHVK